MRNKILILIFLGIYQFISWAQTEIVQHVNKHLTFLPKDLMNIKVITASGYIHKTHEAPYSIQAMASKKIIEREYQKLEDASSNTLEVDVININGYTPKINSETKLANI